MSNPYIFYIGNLRVIVYAPTRAEATRIFSESLEEHDKKIRAEVIDEFFLRAVDAYYSDNLNESELCHIERQLKEQK